MINNTTKHIIAGLMFAALAPVGHAADTTWASVRQAGVLRCGAATSEPVVVRDVRTGQYSGPFAALCEKFAKEVLGVKAEFIDTTWGNIVAGVQTGRWDIAMALDRTPERESAVTFTTAVVRTSTTLVYNKANPKIPAGATAIADIDKPNVTIAVMQGSSIDRDMTQVIKRARLLRLPDSDGVRLALISRRADMLADASAANAIFLAANPDWSVPYDLQPPLTQMDMSLGLNKATPEADVAELNRFIEREKAAGTVQANFDAAVQQSVQNAK